MKKNLFALITALLAFSATMLAAAPLNPNVLEVEIMIFSGRRNPVFTITDPAEIHSLLASAKSLPAAAPMAAPARGGLGYRGIAVRNRSTIDPEVADFVVHHATVELNRGAQARADHARGLEQQLLSLAQARGVLTAAQLAHINRSK